MQGSLRQWNDKMYGKHATHYSGLAGLPELIRARIIRSLADIRASDTVLEVGCEAGNLMARLPRCRRLVGVDISGAALRDARKQFKGIDRHAEFLQCDAAKSLPFKKGEFTVVVCSQTLEHVDEPAKIIENIVSISNPRTRIILTVNDEERNLKIKEFLIRLRLMRILLPTIETETSEWHLQNFSKASFLALVSDKLTIVNLRYLYGLFVMASCKIPEE